MLKVECESCKAPYQVDERRVPPTGLKMRCPKCGHTFVVLNAASEAGPSPSGAMPAAPPRPKPDPKKTMVGVGVPEFPSSGASPVAPPVVANTPHPRGSESLPAALGTLDDLDLPAVPEVAELPAPVTRKAAPAAPVRQAAAPAAPPPVEAGGFGEIDLPSPVADLPSAKPHADLPAARAPRPAPAAQRAPAPRPAQPAAADLPALLGDLPVVAPGGAKARSGGGGGMVGGFGEIDLPAVVSDLPSVMNDLPVPQNNLPAPQNNLPAPQNNLPVPQNALPMAQPKGHNLPAPAQNQNLLPQPVPGANLLPTIGDFGELDLPRVQPGGMQLPAVPTAPPVASAPPADFGELELPGPGDRVSFGAAAPPPPFAPPAQDAMASAHPAWSQPDPVAASAPPIPQPSAPPMRSPGPPPPSASTDRRAGGVGFGEVDLSAEPAEYGSAVGTEVRLSSGPPAGPVGTLAPDLRAPPAVDRPRGPAAGPKRPSSTPKVLVAGAAVFLVGGALLQLTSVGAFGYLWITDKVNAGAYARAAQEGAEKARKRMAADTFAEARGAVDELAQAHARLSRSRPLAAYAALAQYMTELRFGKDGTGEAKANQWLGEIPPNADAKYAPVAQAAQAAVAGDLAQARRALDAAAKAAGSDPLAADIALTRGEVELLAKDGTAAVAAFKKAVEMAPSARAHFGLARAYDMAGDAEKARDEANLALKASPNDAGALTLRAELTWRRDRDDASAMKDLSAVTDGPAKATTAVAELARAHAIRGWVQLSRDRAADARASFDAALKLDARSVLALVGQGEVLYQDGRYAEALGRFDTALQTDPLSIEAIVGDAKTQIKLERLADAKKQLKGARERFPRDMRLALWLGKVEEALGDKKAAEDSYLAAIDLADNANAETVGAYAALASLLAQQGRATEAEGKLEQAKQKLPDSAELERTFGEIAAAQGNYEGAVGYYQKCLQRDPNDIGTRFRLGVTLRRMRRIEPASAEFDKVYATDKEFPGLALERGLLFEESGEEQKALEMFQGALAKAPNDPDLLLRVGAAYVAVGRPDEGIEILKKVAEQRPNSAELQYYMGRAYLQKGPSQEAQAMRYLTKAVDFDPFKPEYHLYVAWAANDAANPNLGVARSEAEKALSLDRLNGDAFWQLAEVERKQGQVEDAIRHAKRALELKPGRIEAHATLAEAYGQKNDVANALVEWKKAIEANDKHPLWRYRYGRLLFDKNAMAEAAKHLQYAAVEAEKLTPLPGWFADADYHAGVALQKIGKRADAIERYQHYVQMAGPRAADRDAAMSALQHLGAPYDSRGL